MALCLVAAHAAFVSRAPVVERFVWVLIGGGLLCLAIPELVYVRDSFAGSELYRMNTVFKLGYQAWLLLAIAGAPMIVWSWGWIGPARTGSSSSPGCCRCSPCSCSPPSTRWPGPTRARAASRTRRTSTGCAGWRSPRPATRRRSSG